MTGVNAIQSRIAELESRFAAPAVVGGAAVVSGEFDLALRSAMGQRGLAGAAGGSSAGAPTGTLAASLLARLNAGMTTPAEAGTPGSYGRLTPPAELEAYGNGRIPEGALVSIGEAGHSLWAPAARSFQQLRAAAAADGVTIGVTDSYRTYESQVDLAQRKGLYSSGGLAATPGTSNHGWGMSLDLDLDSQAQSWMRQNGARYGFVEDVPREPWHWTYRPAGT